MKSYLKTTLPITFMKNIRLTFLLMPVLISCQPQRKADRQNMMFRDGLIYEIVTEEIPFKGVVSDRYPNGKKKSEENYINGKREGLYTVWHLNGQKASEQNYINGMEEGVGTAWYETGQKRMEGNFANGKKEGLSTEWYKNGQKRMEGNFVNGKKEGLWTAYENGQKSMEATFVNGEEVSRKEWDGNGKEMKN